MLLFVLFQLLLDVMLGAHGTGVAGTSITQQEETMRLTGKAYLCVCVPAKDLRCIRHIDLSVIPQAGNMGEPTL